MLPYLAVNQGNGPFLWFPFSARRGFLAGTIHPYLYEPRLLADFLNYGIIAQSRRQVVSDGFNDEIRAWVPGRPVNASRAVDEPLRAATPTTKYGFYGVVGWSEVSRMRIELNWRDPRLGAEAGEQLE